MELDFIQLQVPAECNIIVGQSHFIKTVEDIAEIMAGAVPGAKYGLAFNEASGPCLVRSAGNDPTLVDGAIACALAVGAGHSFYLVLGQGAYPINVLDRIKPVPKSAGVLRHRKSPPTSREEDRRGQSGVIDDPRRWASRRADKADRKASSGDSATSSE